MTFVRNSFLPEEHLRPLFGLLLAEKIGKKPDKRSMRSEEETKRADIMSEITPVTKDTTLPF